MVRRRRAREAAAILHDLKVPLLIHQPSYSLLNRWVEQGLLQVLQQQGIGCIAFSAAGAGPAVGQVSCKGFLPARAPPGPAKGSFRKSMLSARNLDSVRALNDIAQRRGQSLAQMAIAWVLKAPSSPAR